MASACPHWNRCSYLWWAKTCRADCDTRPWSASCVWNPCTGDCEARMLCGTVARKLEETSEEPATAHTSGESSLQGRPLYEEPVCHAHVVKDFARQRKRCHASNALHIHYSGPPPEQPMPQAELHQKMGMLKVTVSTAITCQQRSAWHLKHCAAQQIGMQVPGPFTSTCSEFGRFQQATLPKAGYNGGSWRQSPTSWGRSW